MVELKIKSWDEISLAKYNDIKEILSDNSTEELEKYLQLLSVLSNSDIDEIYNLTLPEVQKLISDLKFINTMPKKRIPRVNYAINGKKYVLVTDMKKVITAQYIDYQNYLKMTDNPKQMAMLMSCFLLPEGKKYGDYDAEEVIDDIYNCLSIVEVSSVCFFFQLLYQSLTKAILSYQVKKLKKMMKKEKDREKKMAIGRAIVTVNQLLDKNGDGFPL